MSVPVTPILVGSLGELNVGVAAAVAVLNPLAAQLDASIALLLGPLQAELTASLQAAIELQLQLSLGLGLNLGLQIDALLQLVAALQAGLSLGISLQLGAEVSAAIALAAAIELKLGLLNALIEAMIAVKIPALRAAAELQASLTGPSAALLAWEGTTPPFITLAQAGSQINSIFSAGIPGGPNAGDNTVGVIIVGAAPSLAASLSVLFPLSPPFP